MGSVYRGTHIELQRTVAIKVLSLEGKRSEQLHERLKREAFALSKLQHENIVGFHALEFADDSLFLVMEFVEGISLADFVRKHGTLSLERSLDVATQLSKALVCAHSFGVVHRDIKPSNVLLREDEAGELQLKLVDFGLAKVEEKAQKLTATNAAVGTALYMSPEQCAGRLADEQRFRNPKRNRSCVNGFGGSWHRVVFS